MGKIAQIFLFKIKKTFLNFIDFCGLQKSRSLNRTYVRKIHKGLNKGGRTAALFSGSSGHLA